VSTTPNRESRATARKPPTTISLTGSAVRRASPGNPTRPIRPTRTADDSNAMAVSTKLALTPAAASSRPAIAGPTNVALFSIVVDTTFAAISSSGERASVGSSAERAGWKAVDATAISPVRTKTAVAGASANTASAAAMSAPVITRSLATITRSRGKRSASTAASGDSRDLSHPHAPHSSRNRPAQARRRRGGGGTPCPPPSRTREQLRDSRGSHSPTRDAQRHSPPSPGTAQA
jgi:hypothetical protein